MCVDRRQRNQNGIIRRCSDVQRNSGRLRKCSNGDVVAETNFHTEKPSSDNISEGFARWQSRHRGIERADHRDLRLLYAAWGGSLCWHIPGFPRGENGFCCVQWICSAFCLSAAQSKLSNKFVDEFLTTQGPAAVLTLRGAWSSYLRA